MGTKKVEESIKNIQKCIFVQCSYCKNFKIATFSLDKFSYKIFVRDFTVILVKTKLIELSSIVL